MICTTCKKEGGPESFHKGSGKGGFDKRCKTCKKIEARKERTEDYFQAYIRSKRSECKKKEIEFNLTKEYLKEIWTGICPIFNCSIVYMVVTGHTNQAHLDRIDPAKGYTVGNVKWISGRANRIKYNATIEELKAILNYMTTENV